MLIIHIILIFRVQHLNSLWQASFWHYKDLARQGFLLPLTTLVIYQNIRPFYCPHIKMQPFLEPLSPNSLPSKRLFHQKLLKPHNKSEYQTYHSIQPLPQTIRPSLLRMFEYRVSNKQSTDSYSQVPLIKSLKFDRPHKGASFTQVLQNRRYRSIHIPITLHLLSKFDSRMFEDVERPLDQLKSLLIHILFAWS